MLFEYRPVPKPSVEKKNKAKDWKKPKPKEKKAKKVEVISRERNGIKPPSRSVRNAFTLAERNKALEIFGKSCNIPNCPYEAVDFHHVIYRSQIGRGVWRNAIPLCLHHHDLVHEMKAFRKHLEAMRIKQFGPYFYMDKWDLWLKGLIEDPTQKEYDKFMDKQGG